MPPVEVGLPPQDGPEVASLAGHAHDPGDVDTSRVEEVIDGGVVTLVPPEVTAPPTAAPAAAAAAAAASAVADVEVRSVSELEELEAIHALYASIWRSDANPPVTTELLRALVKAGNYVAGAFDGPTLVGACVGFFAAPAAGAMHSHIAGVSPSARKHNVGFALKLHQRAWALHRDVSTIEWTFDPLVSRNAYFNIAKLAADPAEYLPNFYGGMGDVINGTDDSDRLLVRWDLRSAAVAAACAGRARLADRAAEQARGAVVALDIAPDGSPLSGSLTGTVSLVAVPTDIETIRPSDPELARRWRLALRETLVELMARGDRITGYDRSGWYVVGSAPASPGESAG